MTTEIKPRRACQGHSPLIEKRADCFEDELIGYNFLRNIWGTYFFERQEISSEDRLDNINKIVGMMKAQVKLMISHQSNAGDRTVCRHVDSQGENDGFNFVVKELERTKELLERSRMREEELSTRLLGKESIIKQMEGQVNDLKGQLLEMKQSRNKSDERIIELSNKIYQLQRGYFTNISQEYQHHDEVNNTLDQYSAISIDHQDDKQKPRLSLFTRRQQVSFDFNRAINDQIRSQQHDSNEKQQLAELDLNLPLQPRNPLKGSLHIYDKQPLKVTNFIQEMKRMKLKTERIVEIQNDRMSQHIRRKTMAAAPTFTATLKGQESQQRRFRRIRC